MSELIVIGGERRKDGKRGVGRRNARERYVWDPQAPESTAIARRVFEDKLEQGYAAFKILREQDEDAKQLAVTMSSAGRTKLVGEQLHEFDSSAETIQMTPPLVGG